MRFSKFISKIRPRKILVVYNNQTAHYIPFVQKIADAHDDVELLLAHSVRLKIPRDPSYRNWDDVAIIVKIETSTGYLFAMKNDYKNTGSVFSSNFNKQIAISKLKELS